MSYNFKSSTACLTSLVVSWLLGAMPTPSALADETYNAIGIVKLPDKSNPLADTDISWYDPGSHTYALADRSNSSIDVETREHEVNLFTAGFAGPVSSPPQSKGPNGVIIVEHRDIWAGDGPVQPCTQDLKTKLFTCKAPGSVKVIDLETGKLKATIYPPGGKGRVDELCASSDVVLAASNATGSFGDAFLTFIQEDPPYNIKGQIFLDNSKNAAINPNTGNPINASGIEQCQFNPRNGKFYQSIVDIGGGSGAVLRIARISGKFKVEKVFQIDKATGCHGPAGLTIGPFHQILVGCNGTSTFSLIIHDSLPIDTKGNGLYIKEVAHATTISGTTNGPDEVWYDPGSNHYFLQQAASGVMGVVDAGDGEKIAPSADPNATTPLTAKNPAVDPFKNHVYLPVLKDAPGSICQKFGGNNSNGCIGIYTGPLDKDDCLAEGEAVIEVDEDGDAKHRKVRCDRD
jgi:hypothetical protein